MTPPAIHCQALKPQQGATLIELLLFAGVVLGAGVAVLAMAMAAADKNKTQDLARDTAQLIENLENGIGAGQSYYGLTNQTLLDHDLVPAGLNQGGAIASGFGPVRLASYGANHDGVRLTLQGIPAKHCPDLVAQLAPLAQELRVGQQVLASRGRVRVESLGACEQSQSIELDRFSAGKGLKAVWETW